jgi:hypothetical protein
MGAIEDAIREKVGYYEQRIVKLEVALHKIVDIEENSPGTVSWRQMVEECKSIADNALNSKEEIR